MAYPFRPKQERVVEVAVSLGSVSECFSGVEDEWNLEVATFALPLKPLKVLQIKQQRVAFVFVPYKVEACRKL